MDDEYFDTYRTRLPFHASPQTISQLSDPWRNSVRFEDGDTIFRAGDDLDLYVIEDGAVEILNPSDGNRPVVTHGPGEFTGDIDLLTRRPAIVTAVARGHTQLLKVTGASLREVLNKLPYLGETMLIAAQERRRLLTETGALGMKVVGPGKCRDTMLVREFLFKNFVPFTWYDSATDKGRELMAGWGSPHRSPVIEFANGTLMINPKLHELARSAGVWRDCPLGPVDLAIIGAGPAGMAAAVYAASEGVSTVVLDRLGPGGQAGGSSKIENFIGFPSGLSGTELATRSVLQMLKFGAKMVAPVVVERIEPALIPEDGHILHLDCGNELQARTVLIAAGWAGASSRPKTLTASNPPEFITHAHPLRLFSTIRRTWRSLVAETRQVKPRCTSPNAARTRTVHLMVRSRLGPAMSDYLVSRIRATPNILVHEGEAIVSIQGGRRVETVTLRSGETLPLSAVFVFIGAETGCDWLPKAIVRDKLGYILTGIEALKSGDWPLKDREPCPLETTVPGILAAGDIRSGSTKRVGFAVGDGSLAVTCVHKLTAIRS